MFKRLETAWNSRTPEYLHPYTKANAIWQLKICAVMVAGMTAYSAYEYHQEQKKLNEYRTAK